ncbi:hypothetical protein MTP03_36940 [Tsukamurella sp. PLM1]|nr:hypothetical protein MTP03_36940 [Tsukamurella sp. PLM1]
MRRGPPPVEQPRSGEDERARADRDHPAGAGGDPRDTGEEVPVDVRERARRVTGHEERVHRGALDVRPRAVGDQRHVRVGDHGAAVARGDPDPVAGRVAEGLDRARDVDQRHAVADRDRHLPDAGGVRHPWTLSVKQRRDVGGPMRLPSRIGHRG